MKHVIFYSWQSDLPNSTNRGFIERALKDAAKMITADGTVDEVPIIDRDTQGIPGAPNIANTIIEKIAAADVLVADVSTIGRLANGDPTPNPNVLIELGYALCSLGDSRIILVLNTAYGAPEDLPFDLKMHRATRYEMPESSTDRATERSALQKDLSEALRAALRSDEPRRPSAPSRAGEFLAELTGPQSELYVTEPYSTFRNEQYYRFGCGPDAGSAARPLTAEVEKLFRQCVIQAFGDPPPKWPPQRSGLTIAEREGSQFKKQRVALTKNGALGFVTPAYVRTTDGHLYFFPTEFLYDLACFLGCAALFYRQAGYRAGCQLQVELRMPQPGVVPDNSTRSVLVPPARLFDEPLLAVRGDIDFTEPLALCRPTGDLLAALLHSVAHAVARENGRVLSDTFDDDVRPIVDIALKRTSFQQG